MLSNYFAVAVRHLLRHRLYSFINLIGLAVGLAGGILILLYVQRELSYDRHHQKADRIYRVIRGTQLADGSSEIRMPGTSGALAPALRDEFPQIQQAVRILNRWQTWVRHEEKGFYLNFCVADTNLFEVFDFPLVQGDAPSLLRQPYSVLITASAARRYFGDENPIGKIVVPENRPLRADYTIVGVLQDLPETAFFRFNFDFLTLTMTPINATGWDIWRPTQFRIINTYLLLPPDCDVKELEQQLPDFMARHMGAEIAARDTYHLQPLTRIHLYSKADYGITWTEYGDIAQVYLIVAIAFFLLLIACINFAGLATARSAQRADEVGVRKAIGARRGQVAAQFLGESMLLTFLALLLALGLADLALPFFNDILEKDLALDRAAYLSLLPGAVAIALFVGLLSGSYPALFLSAFQPVKVLKGNLDAASGGARFRKGLVIFQFAISTLLIIATIAVHQQIEFVRNWNLGFDKEHFVTIWPRMNDNVEAVKQIYLAHPNILAATATWDPMHDAGMLEIVRPEGMQDTESRMHLVSVDEDFLDVFGIELLAGRNFSKEMASDAKEAFLLNESAVRALGWSDPIGKRFAWGDKDGRVIGIVKDFHIGSLHAKVAPIFLCKDRLYSLALKIRPQNIPETMRYIKEKTIELRPHRGFEFSFLDEALDRRYWAEMQLGAIGRIFATLAVFLACLGLFGLIAFAIQQRTKEVGVRKVLGASAFNVVSLLTWDVLKLVLLANLFAWPAAYMAMDKWLESFAYRINLSAWIFLGGSALALIVALATVGSQALKAARANPVDALRCE